MAYSGPLAPLGMMLTALVWVGLAKGAERLTDERLTTKTLLGLGVPAFGIAVVLTAALVLFVL